MKRVSDMRINSERDLNGHRVALVKGYFSSAKVREENPDIKPVMVDTALEGLMSEILSEKGMLVKIANHGEEALDML